MATVRQFYERINVVGVSGSGKSTFSRQLAAALDARYIEMDALFWKPEWTESTDPEFFARLERELTRERWVLDGNYDRTVPIKWRRATLVVWLDYGLPLALWRVVWRTVRRSLVREELWPGTNNRESFGKMFSRGSIVLWTLNAHARQRRRYATVMEVGEWPHLRFVRLRSPREAQRFLFGLAR
jgi:adenylate kinase family enzyme